MASIKLSNPVEIDYGVIRTVLSAERKIRELAAVLDCYGIDHPDAPSWVVWSHQLAAAIAETIGSDPITVVADLDDKIKVSIAAERKRNAKAQAAFDKRNAPALVLMEAENIVRNAL